MPSVESSISLDEEVISDLLYFARAAELPELKETLAELSKTQNTSAPAIVAAATDDFTGNTCCHYAAANGHLDVIQYLVSIETPSDSPDKRSILAQQNLAGNTPLHYAALNGHLDVVKKITQSLPKDARAALVTCKNNAGHDAAFEAEGNDKSDVVSYLLGVLDEADAHEGVQEESSAADESIELDSENLAADDRVPVEEAGKLLADVQLDDDKKT